MSDSKRQAFREAVEGKADTVGNFNQDFVQSARDVRREVDKEVENLDISYSWSSGPVIEVRGHKEQLKNLTKEIEDIVGKYGLRVQTDIAVEVNAETRLSIELIKS